MSGCLSYQVVVVEDHVVRLRLLAQAQQTGDVGVAELAEHLSLAAEVELQLLVPGLQALHQHHHLVLALLDALGFAQQHLAKLPFAWPNVHAAQQRVSTDAEGLECEHVSGADRRAPT